MQEPSRKLRISLASARVNASLTQQEAASLIGVSRNTIQSWESYKTAPNIDVVQKICEVYNVNINDLIFSHKN